MPVMMSDNEIDRYRVGDWVTVTVDGETFEGSVVKRSWCKNRMQVHIPFYYSESVKNGKRTPRVSKSVWVDAKTLSDGK